MYQCKPKKNVYVFSSHHMPVGITSSKKGKPKRIEFYNKTKCGVDVADQMACQYSVKAGTYQWPVAVFYNILELAYINVFSLYKERTRDSISRQGFILKLATELREDYLAERRARSASEQESSRTSNKSFMWK